MTGKIHQIMSAPIIKKEFAPMVADVDMNMSNLQDQKLARHLCGLFLTGRQRQIQLP
uniref:Zinc finger CCCH domain-containing protein 69-like n=1 Tax=Rhizophora mucronata TaxID=61149 RepID=A0A2P2P0H2_RHIMU